jgi:4-amino-4-deoxy-L-arabinose transferase-like glycosyltransferase
MSWLRWRPRGFAQWLAVISVVAGIWRLAYLFVAKWGDDLLLNDSIYFSLQAALNSEGKWFQEGLSGQPGAEHGPLTTLYLTPWSLGSWNHTQQRLGITLVGLAIVPVVGLLGRRLSGERVGLVAAVIAAVYPNLWLNDSLVMSETIAILLVALALLAGLRLEDAPTVARAAVVGGLVGLAALTRSELALLAPLFAVVVWRRVPAAGTWWRPLKLPAVLLLASLLTVSPWIIYNLGRFEHPVLMSTNDGTTFLGANCDVTYYAQVGGWNINCLAPVPQEMFADASERSSARREIALDYIADHWQRLPVVVAARLARTADVYGLTHLVRMDVGEEKAEWAVWAGIVMFWALAVAAVIGWLDLRRRGIGGRWWVAMPIIAVVITTVVIYGFHRLRAPAEPAIVVLAATGLVARVPFLRDSAR